jgi:uncharacterized protein YndB with AHSA1/START domain
MRRCFEREVWRALKPELLQRWLNMPHDIKPAVGSHFHLHAQPVPAAGFGGGPVLCEVLEVEDERLLRFGWGPQWTVTAAGGRGTWLFISHDGFDSDDRFHQVSRKIMAGGWRSDAVRAFERLLDELPG